jgi:dienelactone hydrolase
MNMQLSCHRSVVIGVAAAALIASPLVIGVPTSAGAAPTPGPVEYAIGDQAFYTAPNPIPAGEHGDLVRWQAIETSFGQSYRIMYLSQTVAGAPTVVTGLVAVSDDPPPFGGYPMLLYGHGTTGLADVCAPSVVIGDPANDAPYDSEFDALSHATSDGWVVVATDYEGLGGPGSHPMLVGVSEGRSMLDAGRAARQIPGVYIAASTAITGFSQGGHAALWATQLAPEWTPEQSIVGTVVGAPASEPAALASWATPQPDRSALSVGLAAGLAVAHPDALANLPAVLTPAGMELVQAWDAHCFDEPVTVATPGAFVAADPSTVEPFASLLVANTAGTTASPAPMLILHNDADERIPIVHSEALHARLCAAGQVVERRVAPGGFHTNAFNAVASDGVAWLRGLLDGTITPTSNCPP